MRILHKILAAAPRSFLRRPVPFGHCCAAELPAGTFLEPPVRASAAEVKAEDLPTLSWDDFHDYMEANFTFTEGPSAYSAYVREYKITGYTTTTTADTTTTTTTTGTTTTAPKNLPNDFNGDGTVSLADAVMLARFIGEDASLTADEIGVILQAEPDTDADSLVSISDLRALLSQLA